MKKAQLFWNNKKNIKWFKEQPFSSYWFDFFKKNSIKKAGLLKVLDLGCGGGRNSEMIYRFGYDLYACDKYLGMVNETKGRLLKLGVGREFVSNRVAVQQMDKLPYESSFFDYVISHGVYHNAFSETEFIHAIKESSRILKIGGILCFNIFSSKDIAENMKISRISECLFETVDKLPMVLLSKEQFLKIAEENNLYKYSEPVEYKSEVTTGTRSVLRGFLVKK